MGIRILLLLTIFTVFILAPATVNAESSRFWLKILPKDCVFETVQDGSNEIIYITPEECGELIEEDDEISLPDGVIPIDSVDADADTSEPVRRESREADEVAEKEETEDEAAEEDSRLTEDDIVYPLAQEERPDQRRAASTVFVTWVIRFALILLALSVLWLLVAYALRHQRNADE